MNTKWETERPSQPCGTLINTPTTWTSLPMFLGYPCGLLWLEGFSFWILSSFCFSFLYSPYPACDCSIFLLHPNYPSPLVSVSLEPGKMTGSTSRVSWPSFSGSKPPVPHPPEAATLFLGSGHPTPSLRTLYVGCFPFLQERVMSVLQMQLHALLKHILQRVSLKINLFNGTVRLLFICPLVILL